MVERLLFGLGLVLVGFLIYRLVVYRQLQRARRHAAASPLLKETVPGVPTIVYFTTPTCAPCRFQQTPILQRLQQELGDRMRLIRVDATEQPDEARHWGVFSVPTLFVLDAQGNTRRAFNGVVDLETLKRELAG